MEPEEGLDKVKEAADVCRSYRSYYFKKKAKIAKLFKEDVPIVEWSFNTELIFARLDNFIERLTLIEVCRT